MFSSVLLSSLPCSSVQLCLSNSIFFSSYLLYSSCNYSVLFSINFCSVLVSYDRLLCSFSPFVVCCISPFQLFCFVMCCSVLSTILCSVNSFSAQIWYISFCSALFSSVFSFMKGPFCSGSFLFALTVHFVLF